MTINVSKIFQACVIGAVVWLICVFIGPLLATSGLPFITTVGSFLASYAVPIGFLAGLVYFAFGNTIVRTV